MCVCIYRYIYIENISSEKLHLFNFLFFGKSRKISPHLNICKFIQISRLDAVCYKIYILINKHDDSFFLKKKNFQKVNKFTLIYNFHLTIICNKIQLTSNIVTNIS